MDAAATDALTAEVEAVIAACRSTTPMNQLPYDMVRKSDVLRHLREAGFIIIKRDCVKDFAAFIVQSDFITEGVTPEERERATRGVLAIELAEQLLDAGVIAFTKRPIGDVYYRTETEARLMVIKVPEPAE